MKEQKNMREKKDIPLPSKKKRGGGEEKKKEWDKIIPTFFPRQNENAIRQTQSRFMTLLAASSCPGTYVRLVNLHLVHSHVNWMESTEKKPESFLAVL